MINFNFMVFKKNGPSNTYHINNVGENNETEQSNCNPIIELTRSCSRRALYSLTTSTNASASASQKSNRALAYSPTNKNSQMKSDAADPIGQLQYEEAETHVDETKDSLTSFESPTKRAKQGTNKSDKKRLGTST